MALQCLDSRAALLRESRRLLQCVQTCNFLLLDQLNFDHGDAGIPSCKTRRLVILLPSDSDRLTRWAEIVMPGPSSAALPLNVTPAATPSRPSPAPSSPSGSIVAPSNGAKPANQASDISSPHELTAFVSPGTVHARTTHAPRGLTGEFSSMFCRSFVLGRKPVGTARRQIRGHVQPDSGSKSVPFSCANSPCSTLNSHMPQ